MSNESSESRVDATDVDRALLSSILVLSLVAMIILALFIYIYSKMGSQFLASIEGRVADSLVSEARTMESIGNVEEAIVLYQEALLGSFSDDSVRFWCLRDLGRLLVSLNRNSEGVEMLLSAQSLRPNDSTTLNLLCTAYLESGNPEFAEQLAREWIANSNAPTEPKATAYYHLGQIAESRQDGDTALEYYLAGVQIDPSSVNSYHAAVILEQKGDFEPARRILGEYFPHSAGWRREWAQKIMGRIDSKLAP